MGSRITGGDELGEGQGQRQRRASRNPGRELQSTDAWGSKSILMTKVNEANGKAVAMWSEPRDFGKKTARLL